MARIIENIQQDKIHKRAGILFLILLRYLRAFSTCGGQIVDLILRQVSEHTHMDTTPGF